MEDIEVVPELPVEQPQEAPEAIPEPVVVPEPQPEPEPQKQPEEPVVDAVKSNPNMCAEELQKYFPTFSVEFIHDLRKKHLGVADTVHI